MVLPTMIDKAVFNKTVLTMAPVHVYGHHNDDECEEKVCYNGHHNLYHTA